MSIPRVPDVQCIVVLQGLGEHERIIHSLRLWENSSAELLLIAGQNSNERLFERMTLERLQAAPFKLQKVQGVRTQIEAIHTKDQAKWVAEHVATPNIRSLRLCVPPYHIVRAFLTILKQLTRPVLVIPEPIPMSPRFGISTTEDVLEADDMIAGECERILRYQSKGDVATFDQLRAYLDWIWQQPEIKRY